MVKADIRIMDSFSAHGDRNEMYDFIANQSKIRKLFLVHGEVDSQQAFKDLLQKNGYDNVEIPKLGDSFQLT